MSSNDSTAPVSSRRPFAGLFAVCAVLVTLSALWGAAETHYGQCVDAQAAKYPAVGVSAFTTKTTGPIKVAYDAERRAAIGKCKRFLFV